MKCLSIFCSLIIQITIIQHVLSTADAVDSPDQLEIIRRMFSKWKKIYRKTYPNENDEKLALEHYEATLKRTLLNNLQYYANKSNYLMEINLFADGNEPQFLGQDSFEDQPHGVAPRLYNYPQYPDPPASLDYRKLGYVTRVQDQTKRCSSCYAFAATCGLEGQIAKKIGKLQLLSTQNIIDCSRSYGNQGCSGGSIGLTYKYILQNGGILADSSYPYVGYVKTCAYNSSQKAANLSSYTYITGDENYLKSVLAAVGPLPIGIRGNLRSFLYYSSGIYDDAGCDSKIDHAVCLVGYGTDNTTSPPTDYWIIKNSWSAWWGENGYVRLKMGANLCGVRNYVVYPNV